MLFLFNILGVKISLFVCFLSVLCHLNTNDVVKGLTKDSLGHGKGYMRRQQQWTTGESVE